MKPVRNIFCGLLIAVALCIQCDLFQIYLYSFDDFWQTSFYVKEDIDTQQMKEQIFESAKDYGLEVIYIDKAIEGDYHTRVDIYCSASAKKMFAGEYQLREGSFGSLFSGQADVAFHSVDELTREQMAKEPEGYFLLGQTENAYTYKAALVDTYGGSIPRPRERDSIRESLVRLFWIWLAVGILIWLPTYYKTVRIRKEIVIRLSFGEPIGRIVMSQAVMDALWYSGCFLITSYVLHRIFHILFLIQYAAGALAFIILGEFLIYALLLRCDLKLGFSGVQMSRKLLDTSYVLKTALTFALAVSAASTLALWIKYSDMEKQKEFYEARGDYYYLYLVGDSFSAADETWFYRNYFTMFDIQFSCGNGTYDMEHQDRLAVCINANLQDYLCENLPSVAEDIAQSRACLLIPEGMELSEESMEMLIDISADFANLDNRDVMVLTYNDRAYIINYDVYRGYVRTYCPVILYNNCIEDERTIEQGRILFELNFGKTMMKINWDELDQFCDENGCRYVTENVWLTFEHQLLNLKRGAFMNMMFLIFQWAIELFLSAAIIKLEFETNRLEIVMKKILGYSVARRIGRQLILTLVSGAVGLGAAVVVYTVFGLAHIGFMCVLVLLLMMMETAVMFRIFLNMEKESIQKTLKGGFL